MHSAPLSACPQSPNGWPLRPSAAATWIRCAGWLRLTRDLPDEDDGDNTVREEGTACHWAAFEVSQGRPVELGQIAPNGVEITEEMQDAVVVYRNAIAAWCNPDVLRYFETPVHCKGVHPLCGGTADVFAWDSESATLFIGDLKFGFRFVDAMENWQLLCYYDGAMHFFGLRPQDVRRVVFMICQPRSYGAAPVRQWEATPMQLAPMMLQLAAAAAMTQNPEALCTTNQGCTNCAGRRHCEALRQAALDVVDVSHEATPHDLPFAAAENELRMLQWAADIVDARISGLQQQVQRAMQRGHQSRHYELQPGQSRLQWTEEGRKKITAIAHVLKVEITKPATIITPTQALDKLGEAFVKANSHRPAAGLKLVQSDVKKWRRIFGK